MASPSKVPVLGSESSVAGEDPSRYHQGAGQIDEMWIVDVNGRVALLDGTYYADTPQDARR